ncbi:hypothetical protein LOAG_14651 [Loa loa]|uniref:Uncharacterized protein n=1 Tax=Loa loa TaxID=7209 RepID=A0A1S0THV3_LOALO|nr:hypothetical protein LOAG_14651 [Loa loa]EFO13876.1 hypothetical protein LOAG_14651 [Loa loa]
MMNRMIIRLLDIGLLLVVDDLIKLMIAMMITMIMMMVVLVMMMMTMALMIVVVMGKFNDLLNVPKFSAISGNDHCRSEISLDLLTSKVSCSCRLRPRSAVFCYIYFPLPLYK